MTHQSILYKSTHCGNRFGGKCSNHHDFPCPLKEQKASNIGVGKFDGCKFSQKVHTLQKNIFNLAVQTSARTAQNAVVSTGCMVALPQTSLQHDLFAPLRQRHTA
eukprot:3242119-Amphidinium_carterae.1